jgi:FlaA1/EpsC-like NDP-sugar epimerase
MGAPVRILDLARRMIELSGLSLRDATNPDGDIAIEVTGLRPGEKLYEELLIGEDVIETPHPKIMRAREMFPARPLIEKGLAAITEAVAAGDEAALIKALSRLVPGFRASLPEAGVPRASLPGLRKSGKS